MSATVDLFVCRVSDSLCDGSETPRLLYEAEWLLTDFTDTSGVFRSEDPGKAAFIETIFSRSAEHRTLVTHRPAVLADRKYPRTRRSANAAPTLCNFSAHASSSERYIVERTPLLQRVWTPREQQGVEGLLLSEFIAIIRRAPESSGIARTGGHTKPMALFLEGLPENSLVIPLIGSGLTRELGDLSQLIGFRPAIINL